MPYHLLVVPLYVVPKLAFSVKPQATLRTFIGMASASEGKHLNKSYQHSVLNACACLFLFKHPCLVIEMSSVMPYLCSAMCFLNALRLGKDELQPGKLH